MSFFPFNIQFIAIPFTISFYSLNRLILFDSIFLLLFFHKIDTLHTSIASQQLPSYSSVCNASSSHSQNAPCNNQCHFGASNKMHCSNQFTHHSLIPHSKSMEHYNVSRPSFDNYKNYDCIDVADQNNGCHYSSIIGNHHQSNKCTGNPYNFSGNRHPLPQFSDAYSQIGNEDLMEPNHSSCCHQNLHYDYGRSAQLKSKKTDYSNCNFSAK